MFFKEARELRSLQIKAYTKNAIEKDIMLYRVFMVGKYLFHFVSIFSTGMFLLPYLINLIDGGLYQVGSSLEKLGIAENAIEIALFLGLFFAGVLEIVSVNLGTLWVTTFRDDEDVVKKAVVSIAVIIVIGIQLATMVGGLKNSYIMLKGDRDKRILLEEYRKQFSEINTRADQINKKITRTEAGDRVPADELIVVKNESYLKTLKENALEIKKEIEEKKLEFEAWRASENTKAINFRGNRPTLFYQNEISKREKEITELKNRLLGLVAKIKEEENKKVPISKEEYIKRLEETFNKVSKARLVVLAKIQKLQKEIKENEDVLLVQIDLWKYWAIAILVVLLQITLEYLTKYFKEEITAGLDRARFNSGRKEKRVLQELTQEPAQESGRESALAPSPTADAVGIEKVLDYMVEVWRKEGRLPSISETSMATGYGATKIKSIRAGMRGTYFKSDESGKKIEPTELFLSLANSRQ